MTQIHNDQAEHAYWQFDARRKGYAEWRGSPQSEREAFKAEYIAAVAMCADAAASSPQIGQPFTLSIGQSHNLRVCDHEDLKAIGEGRGPEQQIGQDERARQIMFAAYSRCLGDDRLTPNQIADVLLSARAALAHPSVSPAPVVAASDVIAWYADVRYDLNEDKQGDWEPDYRMRRAVTLGADCPRTNDNWKPLVDALAAASQAAPAEQKACSHVWNDFGQLGGRNVVWCPRCDTLAWTGKEPAAAPAIGQAPTQDYSEMSREQLERHAARMAQALADDKPREFWRKYALGPMLPPSCLCCGKLPDEVAIKHAELPGIVVCQTCRSAIGQAPTAEPVFYVRAATVESIATSGFVKHDITVRTEPNEGWVPCYATPAEPSRAAIDTEAFDAK